MGDLLGRPLPSALSRAGDPGQPPDGRSACRAPCELYSLFRKSPALQAMKKPRCLAGSFKLSEGKLHSHAQRKCHRSLWVLWMEDVKGNSTHSLTTHSIPPQNPFFLCLVLLHAPVEHFIHNMCKSLGRNIPAPPAC